MVLFYSSNLDRIPISERSYRYSYWFTWFKFNI